MSFGKMRTRITIAEPRVSKDTDGFGVKEDIVLRSLIAYREGRHGSEKWANRAVFSEATDLFRFRVIPGVEITTDLVIVCGTHRFEITSVEDVKGRGMYVEALCLEVKPDGEMHGTDA